MLIGVTLWKWMYDARCLISRFFNELPRFISIIRFIQVEILVKIAKALTISEIKFQKNR